jgi:type II secretory pathway pseudopilin PulG
MMFSKRTQHGLTYLEVLIAVVILVIAMPAALATLSHAVNQSRLYVGSVESAAKLKSTMEMMLNVAFSDLDAEALSVGSPTVATSYSESAGTPNRALVYLSRYDGDNADVDDDPFTGVDADLLWIKVAIENRAHSFETVLTP